MARYFALGVCTDQQNECTAHFRKITRSKCHETAGRAAVKLPQTCRRFPRIFRDFPSALLAFREYAHGSLANVLAKRSMNR